MKNDNDWMVRSEPEVTMNRKEYMDASLAADRGPSKHHRDYYSQFVTGDIVHRLSLVFNVSTLVKSYRRDPFFNTPLTPLSMWDRFSLPSNVARAIMKANASNTKGNKGWYSLSDTVCIYKEAARLVAEHELRKNEKTKD